MAKKVLITGALGLVGSHIAESLVARNDQVLGIDNLKTGRRINLPENTEVDLHIGDISDGDVVLNLVKDFQPDVIIHCAASYADPKDWIGDSTTNILGSIKVAEAATAVEARVIYFQTALCYGLSPTKNPIPIDYPRNPAPSSYAISKTGGELFLELAGLDLVTFRLANIVGPRNLSGALPIFYNRLAGSQKCTIAEARRDFVDVRDVVPVVLKAVDGTGSGAYHLSSGSDVSILELYNLVADTFVDTELPAPDVVPNPSQNAVSILLDPSRTFNDFGEISFRPLAETVSAAVAFYKEYGVSEERTHFHFKSK
ncbi:MAG: NAD-dependent epimerase/dehydratase family protein [Actinomycetes bacterium]